MPFWGKVVCSILATAFLRNGYAAEALEVHNSTVCVNPNGDVILILIRIRRISPMNLPMTFSNCPQLSATTHYAGNVALTWN